MDDRADSNVGMMEWTLTMGLLGVDMPWVRGWERLAEARGQQEI